MADITLQGDKDLMAKLDGLPEKLRKKVLTGAVRKAARPVQAAAKAKAPRREEDGGHLANSIAIKVKSYPKSGNVIALIGPDKKYLRQTKHGKVKPANYAHLVEHGVRPHAVGKGSLVVIRRGGTKFRTVTGSGPQHGGMHPGVTPRPFLRPAVHSQAETAFRILGAEIGKGLERIAREGANQ